MEPMTATASGTLDGARRSMSHPRDRRPDAYRADVIPGDVAWR
jgi:hypothetical protein